MGWGGGGVGARWGRSSSLPESMHRPGSVVVSPHRIKLVRGTLSSHPDIMDAGTSIARPGLEHWLGWDAEHWLGEDAGHWLG
eukprot:68000-Chlamydomonas_euryale.AAC.2